MEKNIRCPDCNANAFHINRIEDGIYEIMCVTGSGKEHPKRVELATDTLENLRK